MCRIKDIPVFPGTTIKIYQLTADGKPSEKPAIYEVVDSIIDDPRRVARNQTGIRFWEKKIVLTTRDDGSIHRYTACETYIGALMAGTDYETEIRCLV